MIVLTQIFHKVGPKTESRRKVVHDMKKVEKHWSTKYVLRGVIRLEVFQVSIGTCGLSVTTFFHQVLNYYYLTVYIMFKPKMSLEGSVH